MTDIVARKAAARVQARARLAGCDPASGGGLAAVALAHGAFAGTVAGVWPMRGEIDLRPLLLALHERGHRIVLPHTPPLGQPLAFRVWTPGCAMVREAFGTWRPNGALAVPDTLLVPLLAFDRDGYRLGHGGGYYDRTLAMLAGRPAYGTAFAAQEVDSVPREPHDRRLTAIITERAFIRP